MIQLQLYARLFQETVILIHLTNFLFWNKTYRTSFPYYHLSRSFCVSPWWVQRAGGRVNRCRLGGADQKVRPAPMLFDGARI